MPLKDNEINQAFGHADVISNRLNRGYRYGINELPTGGTTGQVLEKASGKDYDTQWSTPSSGLSFDDIYPVGSIYMSVNNVNPGTLFGGTWSQIQDTFLLAAGTNYTAGSTGGAASHKHTTGNCTLTVNQIPSHTHLVYGGNNTNPPDWFGGSTAAYGIMQRVGTSYDYLQYVGGGQAHNHGDTGDTSNLPPYLAVYVWQRTA